MTSIAPVIPEDQFSPKELLKKIIIGAKTALKHWKVIVLCTALGYGIGFALDLYLKKPTQYEATILFNMGGGSSNSFPMGGDLASTLLGGAGGTPDANLFSGENFFIFAKSRPVIERALMKKKVVFGKEMILANLYIDSCGIKEKEWKKMEDRHSYQFTIQKPDSFNLHDQEILNDIVLRVSKETDIGQPERKSSFLLLKVNSENGTWSRLWAQTFMEVLEEVYTEIQTAKTTKMLSIHSSRLDSISRQLGSSETSLARQIDQSALIVDPTPKVSINRLTRKNEFLVQQFNQLTLTIENLKVSLIREAPLFTTIEPIKKPLDVVPDYTTRSKIGLITGFLFSLLLVYLLVTLKTIREELSRK